MSRKCREFKCIKSLFKNTTRIRGFKYRPKWESLLWKETKETEIW